MSRIKTGRFPRFGTKVPLAPLLLLAGFFAAGLILGQVLCGRIPESTAEELTRYLKNYLELGQGKARSLQALPSALLLYFRYPLLAFLLGFASIGILLLPLLSALYGFFLSFSVCCFVSVFGPKGVFLAAAVLGIRCLASLPCYFFLAVPAFVSSASLAVLAFGSGRRAEPVRRGGSWRRLLAVCAVLLAGAAAELVLTPALLRLTLTRILAG